MTAYVVGFILLFILSGLGNGSTYKMIPSIFEAKAQGHDERSREEKAATNAFWVFMAFYVICAIVARLSDLGKLRSPHGFSRGEHEFSSR
jgi:nitrate/nitrite transporter NarK